MLLEESGRGYRTPRRFAAAKAGRKRASVLDCASPLALWDLPRRPEYPDICLELGRTFANRGDMESALKYCDLAQRRHFDDGRLHVLKAKILEGLNRREEAIRSLREAIRLQPALWEAHDRLGAEVALDGKLAEAQAEFEQVVRLRPGYGEGHLNLGIALARQQRYPEALAQFHETLRLEPDGRKAQEFLSTMAQVQKPGQ